MAPKNLATGVCKNAKRCELSDDLISFQSTHTKPMKFWTPQEVITWLCDEAYKHGLNYEKIHLNGFQCVDGSALLKLTLHEFVEKAQASGYSLYHIVSRHKRKHLHDFPESRQNECRNESLRSLVPNHCITAVGKKSPFSIGVVEENKKKRCVSEWTSEEVAVWLCKEALKYNYDYEKICLTNFHGVNGETLIKMGECDFIKNVNSSIELGRLLYKSMEELKRSNEPPWQRYHRNDSGGMCISWSPIHNEEDENASHYAARPSPKSKTKNSRPRVIRRKGREKSKKREQLWIFILNLLKNSEYSNLICWENQAEGLFRIVDSRKLADLWGSLGGKTGMNYEKFSRAMRTEDAGKVSESTIPQYYYQKNILLSVTEKLLYQFGPASWGWKPESSTHNNHSEESICLQ